MLRDLSALDRDICQPLGRIIGEAFRDGINCSIIHGGRLAGGVAQTPYQQSVSQNYIIGSKLRMVDGREFIYSKAGAGGHAIGTINQAEARTTNWADEVQTAYGFAIGQSAGIVLITTGAAPAANEWKGGSLLVNSGTGIGQCHRILTNTSHLTLPYVTLNEGVVSAILAADHVTISKNPFLDTIIAIKATITGRLTGVALLTVTGAYFYWSQVKGFAPLLVDTGGALVIGDPVGIGGAVDGSCDIAITITDRIGIVLDVAPATEYATIDLNLGL